MASISNQQSGVTRTECGLVIAGTRITLYQLMDYIHAGYSYQNIRQDFPQIADEQFNAAMSYIEANRAEVEAEYQIVIKEDEEVKRYWEEQNRDRFAKIALIPPKPEQEAIREKLAEWKARIVSRTNE